MRIKPCGRHYGVAGGPKAADTPIDCGNSGTTSRLLMGILAPWECKVTLTGTTPCSAGLCARRVTTPLVRMGARFYPEDKDTCLSRVCGTKGLRGIEYDSPVASAQVKTAVLLAGVFAQGTTVVTEPSPSRNHTELMLPLYGVSTTAASGMGSVEGPAAMHACEIDVPGDPSSAAFLACAAALVPGSAIASRTFLSILPE
ncbi:MAG: hypothetical protein ACLTQI_01560 [Slackia sp.]